MNRPADIICNLYKYYAAFGLYKSIYMVVNLLNYKTNLIVNLQVIIRQW